MTNDDSISTSNASNPSPQSLSPSLGQNLCDFESFEFHEEENAFQAFYSDDVASPSLAVVSAVAAASDTDPLDMEPLHATVDADALDSLITPRRGAVGDLHITFEYGGCEVTASSYGSLTVKPLETHRSPAAADD